MGSLHEIYEATVLTATIEVEEDYFMISEESMTYREATTKVN